MWPWSYALTSILSVSCEHERQATLPDLQRLRLLLSPPARPSRCERPFGRILSRGHRPAERSVQVKSRARSSAGAEWVSAPTDIQSTPVLAIARTVVRLTPPE